MSLSATVAERLGAWWDTAWVQLSPTSRAMLLVGLVGQSLFIARWAVQLMASERARRSVVPALFWHLSFAGSLLVLAYALYKADLVLLLGQFGIAIYARNLYLIMRHQRLQQAGNGAPEPAPARST
jgi:lipid-A-disaccharide synthase-like uncharacterized protein